MKPPKVFLSQPMHHAGIDLLGERCELIRGVHYPTATDAEIEAALSDADAVMIRSMPLTAARMDKAPKLRVIAKHGAGMDSIDVPAATARGIVVANSGDANAFAVAQHAVALMLAVQRRIIPVDRRMRQGDYQQREKLVLGDLWRTTVGLAGLGNIGRHVAHMVGRGFDATVLGFDPAISESEMRAFGVEKVEQLQDLLLRADIVSLHMPLNRQTRHMIGAVQLSSMKPQAIIVNTSRGGIIDEEALFNALSEGTIAGAGLDVFEEEPTLAENPLFALEQLVTSPHVGGSSEVAKASTSLAAARAIIDVFDGRAPQYFINQAGLSETRAPLATTP